MDESRQGWRRGGKTRGAAASGGKGWQSRKQPAAKTGTSRHRTRLVALGLVTVSLLAGFIIVVLIIPRDMPLVVLGVVSYESPIPPNAYVSEDAARLAGTNTRNIKLMAAKSDQISREAIKRHLKENLHPGRGFVSQELITVYLSAHGVVDSQGKACLLLSDSKPLDESTWFPISELFKLLDSERPNAVKVVLLDSGKIDANWSLGVLYNSFPDRVAEELRNHSKVFVVTDRASGQLAWSAPERGGSIFGHFVATGFSAAADKDRRGGVSLLEFYDFVSSHVDGWVSNNRSSRQTPLLLPTPTTEQDIKLVSAGSGPTGSGSGDERIAQLSSAWRQDVWPLWTRYEKFARDTDLRRYDPIGLATLEAELLRAEQLLLAGSAYGAEYSETIKNIASLMSDAAKPTLPDELRGFSLPLAAQFEGGFDPEGSVEKVLAEWLDAGGWPKDEEGKEQTFSLPYLEAANVASRWLLESPTEPGGLQLRDAVRLIEESGRHNDVDGAPIEDLQEIQLVKLVLQHADVADSASWSSALRAALREAMHTQQIAERTAAPVDERVHYWVQPLLAVVDQRRREALDDLFIGDDASLARARANLAQCRAEDGAKARQRLVEVSQAYVLRDHVWSRLPHLAFWFSQREQLDARQPGLDSVLQRVAELSALLNADNAGSPLDFGDQHQSIIEDLREASDGLEQEFGNHVASLLKASPASGTLLKAHHVLRAPLANARDREDLFLDKYLASMELDKESSAAGDAPNTEAPKLTRWPSHPAVVIARPDKSIATTESAEEEGDSVAWFDAQGGLVRDALREIGKTKSQLQKETEDLLRSEDADATARRTRSGVARADELARSAAALLGQRPWPPAADPTRRLRHVDRHYQLLWHSHRSLKDFWGPTKSLRNLPYFANVADAYLDGAKLLAPSSAVLGHGNELDLRRLRDDRVTATGIEVSAESELKCYDAEETRPHDFTIDWKQKTPLGRAAVFITGGAGSKLFPVLDGVSQVRRRAQEVDERASKVEQRLELAKPADRTELPLAARVLFRGHEQSQRFTAKWPRHTMPVRAEYTHPQEAKVTVEGDAERIGHIMFIVDCSLSMNERGKMTRAIDSLSRVLDELGNQANYAIGLRAYGRQSGFILPTDGGNDYQKDGNGNYLVRRLKPDGEYEVVSNDDPVGLHPDDDADDLLEPMALRKNQANAIRERIKDLRPNGVTPLYRALTNSLKTDFVGRNAVRDEGNTKHIVLITDGNDLFSKRKALGKTPTQTSAADVHSAWERSGSDVQVHIIFMDPPAQVAAELKEIPEKTGGIYKGANEAAALVQGIRQAIGLVEFSVDQPGSSNPDTPKYRLGETAKVTGLRQDYEVRIHGAPAGQQPTRKIYLDGGEKIKLIYEHPLNRVPRLMFPIEDPDAAYSDAPVVPGRDRQASQHEFVIRAHRPEVQGMDVDFSITVQDVTGTSERDRRTEHFTPPIRQVWCEITPVVGDTALTDQRYYFGDVDTVLDQPVPKLRFHAKDWLGAATNAQMKVWFRFDPFRRTPTGFEGETIEDSGKSRSFSVPGLEGVKFDASGQKLSIDEPYRLTIHETNTSLGTAAIIVSPAADAISHTYYSFGPAGSVAKHVYEFERPLRASIDVLTSSQFKKNLISVPQLEVIVKE